MKRPVVLAWLIFSSLTALTLHAGDNTSPQTPEERLAGEIQAAQVSLQMILASHQGPWTEADIAQVRKIYREIAAHHPGKAEPFVALGEFLAEIDHAREAFGEFQTAQKLEPERGDILASLSGLIMKTGDTVEATRLMEIAVAKAPNEPAYHYGLAHLYFIFRQDLAPARHLKEQAFFDLAMKHYLRASELAPQDLNYARTYAETFYTIPRPDWKLALAAWEKVLALSPDPSLAQTHLVRVNIRLKNKPAAQQSLSLVTDPAFAPMKKSLQRQIDQL